MTLRTRNRLFFIMLLSTIILSLICILSFIVFGITGHISAPTSPVRTFTFIPKVFRYQFPATIIDILFFALYVPVTMAFVYFGFKNTQSLEIIYFSLFLLGAELECIRIIMPIYSMWQTTSTTTIIVGRFVLAGRLLTFLSMLCTALFYKIEDRQNLERNILLCILGSVIIGSAYPLNTLYTTSTCTVLWAYVGLFTVVRLCLFIVTIISMVLPAVATENGEIKHETGAYILLMIGYLLLCAADTYTFVIVGILMLCVGTLLYLRAIHASYLWR